MDEFNAWLTNFDLNSLTAIGLKLVAALVILVIGRWVAKAFTGFLRRGMEKRNMDALLVDFSTRILYAVLLLVIILTAIASIGVDIAPLMVLLGGSALAVGLALQGSLSNFASGLMLVIFHPFGKGDFVEAGGVSGTVIRVGIFNTELKTPDNRNITVPNSSITSSPITNFSANPTRRVDLLIGVHYDDDLKVARDTIMGVLKAHDKVLKDPAPVVLVMELADSSVNIAARPWVNAPDFWVVRSELMEQIKSALEAAGCSIPFPQRDVHLYQTESGRPT